MGRKRKAGKRTKSGRLSRAKAYRYDKGNHRAQAMQAIYGSNGSDAIGRAYTSGLLGSGQDAKAMLDSARSVSNAYWRAYETGRIICMLGRKTGGGAADGAKDRKREEWLAATLQFVNRMGHAHRRAFDQLVIDPHPDDGPAWLDRLLAVDRHNAAHVRGKQLYGPRDHARLKRALEVLQAIAL